MGARNPIEKRCASFALHAYGNTKNLKKNPFAILRALGNMWNGNIRSASLMQLPEKIVKYARRTSFHAQRFEEWKSIPGLLKGYFELLRSQFRYFLVILVGKLGK